MVAIGLQAMTGTSWGKKSEAGVSCQDRALAAFRGEGWEIGSPVKHLMKRSSRQLVSGAAVSRQGRGHGVLRALSAASSEAPGRVGHHGCL